MKKHNIILTALTLLTSISLTGCNDNSEAYKQRIQQDNDRINPTGNKAICLSLGKLAKSDFPYTIQYIEGEEKPNLARDPIYRNNKLNRLLTLYAKEGLFTEERVGEDNGKPLYRYQLTAEGLKYAHWWAGSGSERTYFCFGRVVVDKINDSYDIGVNSKEITFSFHYENIPDWIKPKEIYTLYYPNISGERDVTGQSIIGVHEYYLYNGQPDKLVSGMSGRYTP